MRRTITAVLLALGVLLSAAVPLAHADAYWEHAMHPLDDGGQGDSPVMP